MPDSKTLMSSCAVMLLLGTLGIPGRSLVAPAAAQTQAEAPNPAASIEFSDEDFAPEATIPFDPRVRTGTLDNGLRWYVRENTEPEKRAALRLVINAGSILEDEDQQGLAHFLEHMAFNGTEHFEKQALVEYLESIGMQFGPEINAYTSFDETVYMLMVPTDDEEILDKAFEVLGDWSRRITLDPEEVVKERGVVLEEWRLGRGARQRVSDEQLPVIYHGSRYAQRLPIGLPEIIENADPQRLRRFYQDWYRPELMAVVAIGDFDGDEVIARIEDNFGQEWGPRTEDARDRVVFDVPSHDETLVTIATDEELTTSNIQVMVKKPRERTDTVADYHVAITESLFDGMLNQRLRELTQKPDPPFIFGRLGGSALGRTVETFSLSASTEDGGIPRALEAILIEAKRVQEHGFTAAELDRQKARVMRSLRSSYEERENTRSESYAGRYGAHFLDDARTPGIEWRFALYQRVLPTITLDEVNALAARRDLLVEENRVIAVSAPEKDGVPVPTEGTLRAVFARVAETEVEPYSEELSEAPLMAESPAPGEILEEETIDELGLTVWTLDNGNRVYVKPTDFKEDEVRFTAFSPGGRSLGTLALDRTLDFATTAVTTGGLADFSATDLQKKLAGKRASVSPFIGTLEEGLRGSASPEDLELALTLAWLYVNEPRRDEDAFAAIRQRYKAFIANRASDPNSAYGDTLGVTLSGHHPWSTPLQAEELDDLDLDRAIAFYRDRFADVGDLTWVFVGNIDLEELRALVEQYVATLPATGRVESWRDPGVHAPPGPLHKIVRAGVDEKARTTLFTHGPMESNRQSRFVVGALGRVLQIRLREVIREEMSGTYGVQVRADLETRPREEWSLTVSFGADPERLDELVAEVFHVLETIRSEGIETSYVDKVREQFRREYEEGQTQNGYWLGNIAYRARYGIDQREQLETEELIEALRVEDVEAMAQAILGTDAVIRIDMVPAASEADAGR